MAYKVLIANVPITCGGKFYPVGSELPQKELSDADIDDLVKPKFEGDRLRAHWEVRGRGDVETKEPEPEKKGKGK